MPVNNENLKKLNKLLRTISKINQQLVIIRDEKKLCKLTCKYLVEIKGFKYVWIGLKENKNDYITPIAISGKDKDFVKSIIKNSWDKYNFCECPSGASLKSGKSFVINDLKKEERFVPWDIEAIEKGFLSAIVLPLKYYGEIIGTLHIYSDIKDYFTNGEIKFLKEVAGDISIGIKSVRNENKLIESKTEYEELFKRMSSCVSIYEVEENGKDFIFKDINSATERVEKVKKEDVIGKNVLAVFPGVKDFGLLEVFKRVFKSGKSENFPLTFYKDNRISGWKENFVYKLSSGDIVAVYDDLTEKKQNEEEIKSLAKFPEENPSPVGRIDYNGKLLYCNHACKRISKDNDYIHYKLKNAIKKLTTEKKFTQVDVEIKVGDRIFLFDLIPIKKEKYINFYGRDITERKKIEEELRESEEKYRTLFSTSGEGILIADIETHNIKYVNPAICQMLGYSEKELKTMGIADIHPKEDLQSVLAEFQNLARGIYSIAADIPCLRKDGTIFYADINSTNIVIDGKKCGAGFFHDITERKNTEKRLKQQTEAMEATVDGIAILSKEEKYIYLNKAHAKIYGYDSPMEMVGKSWTILYDCDELQRFKTDIIPKLMENGYWQDEAIGMKKDGSKFFQDLSLTTFSEGGLVCVVRNIDKRKKREDEFIYLGYHDYLTGLYNRRFVEEEIKRLDTKRQLPLSFVMGDLNSLKLINDTFGHSIGDRLLKEIAELLKKVCRSEDVLARWGADEFVILLPKTSNIDSEEIVQRIKKQCVKLIIQKIPLSMAIGIATKIEANQGIDEIIKEAESNMYKNKLIEKESSASSIISALEQTLFEKSSETMEHAFRIKDNAIKLGREVKLHSSQLDELSLLASLHDIGKVAIPETILLKEGKLTEKEWVVIKRHPEIGFNIAQASPQIVHIAKFILACHENWDGSGYPQGLAGESIPILSRIVSIADAYDVMTSERIYKKTMNKDAAVEELKRCAGTQFDPILVNKFIDILSNGDMI